MEKDILKTKGIRLREENVFYFSIRYKRIVAAKFTAYQEWVCVSTDCCCSCADSPDTLWLPQLSDMLCRRGGRSVVSLTNDEIESGRWRQVGIGCLLCSPHVIITSTYKQFQVQEKCEKNVDQLTDTWDRCPDWSEFSICVLLFALHPDYVPCMCSSTYSSNYGDLIIIRCLQRPFNH